MSPDPSKLVWDKVVSKPGKSITVTSLHGWLKVPLTYDVSEGTPHVCLRVSAFTTSASPAQGVLYMHCGGPGEGRSCPTKLLDHFDGVLHSFASVGINQRGLLKTTKLDNDSMVLEEDQVITETGIELSAFDAGKCPFNESDGKPVLPFPQAECNSIVELLLGPENGSLRRDFHATARAYEEALSQGGLSAEEMRALDAKLMEPVGPVKQRVVDLIKQLKGKGAELPSEDEVQVVVWALWIGDMADGTRGVGVRNETLMRWYYRLADLEHNMCVRRRKYHISGPDGEFYNLWNFMGTGLLAHDLDVLRSALGEQKLSLFGGSYGTTVVAAYATLFPDNVDRLVMDGVVPPEMELFSFLEADSMGLFSVWQGIARDCEVLGSLDIPQKYRCPLAPMPSTKLLDLIKNDSDPARASAAFLQMVRAIVDVSVAPTTMHCLAELYGGGAIAPECAATPGWNDTAVGILTFASKSHIVNRFWTWNGAIFGSDVSGRLSEESFVSWWQENLKHFPFGTWRTVKYAAAMGAWPLNAQPLPPLGNGATPALIIGNLHDDKTDYTGAQKMRAAFPKGRLMTWQGYGHVMVGLTGAAETGTSATREKNVAALTHCKQLVSRYLTTGELPDDGHTCLIAKPLGLGRASFCESNPDSC